MARNDDALARDQRCSLRHLIDLGERPQGHVVKRRERQQRIARPGEHRHAAVPQLDRDIGRNNIAKRHRLAFCFRRRRRKLQNLGDQLLMDQVHLVDIDVRHVLLLREIEACIVTLITLFRHHVAATQNAVRQEDVDVALDIERYAGAGVSRIDRDEQAHRDAFGLELFRELQRTKAAH